VAGAVTGVMKGVVAAVVEMVVAGESVFNLCEEGAIGAVYELD